LTQLKTTVFLDYLVVKIIAWSLVSLCWNYATMWWTDGRTVKTLRVITLSTADAR